MTTEYELTLHDYIDIVRRRALLMLAVFIVVILSAVGIALVLPPVYQSSGTILIESQQIPSDFIASTVTGFASERIEVIKQRVMTRENLLRIIRKYGLYKNNNEKRVTSELIDDIRDHISINLLSSDFGGRRRNKATIAFNIVFEYRNPEQTYKVTNELVTLFLDENIKSRVERATETTVFLSNQANRLKADLEKVENLVAAYKQEHADALPEHLKLHVEMLQRTEATLASLDRDYMTSNNELRSLDLQLSAAESGAEPGTLLSELERLNAEYQQAIVLYKGNHPTVRTLKRRIEALKKGSQSGSDHYVAGDNTVNAVFVSKLRTLIDSAKNQLISLGQQRKPLRKKITDLEKQIIKTPQVELGLTSLMRDHGSARNKYEEIQSKQLSAQIAENLEGENKSERFTLIDPPLRADKPIKPNRIKILLIGLFVAFGAAAGIAFLLEMLNQRIRGKGALTSMLGHAPLVEIPYITTSDEHKKNKELIIRISVGSVVFVVITSLLVNFLYMRLDILLYKILARLG